MEAVANRQFVELEDTHFWFIGRRRIFMHLLAQARRGHGPARILDVGCGAGGMLGPLGELGEVSGIESSAELVEFCHQRGFSAVKQGSALELPEPAQSYELVTLLDVIEHIPDDVAALREACRVLVPGGLAFISVPAYQFLYANNDRVAHHQRRYTRALLRRRLLAAGLEPVRVSYFNTLLFPAILPAVLAKKLFEVLRGPDDSTNLSHEIPQVLNRVLAAAMSSERRLLVRRDFPFGHSLLGLARAPA